MPDGLTVEFSVHFGRGAAGRKDLRAGKEPPTANVPPGNLPRVARLMALAIRCEELVRSGEVQDYAELARVGHITRARMTQIMNLIDLAPDIQEAILFLPIVTRGRDPISERDLRSVAATSNWTDQRRIWRQLLP